jgi:hypothetical protein
VTGWKVFCSIILMPLNFLPLRLLSFTSVIGIFSCFTSKCRRTVAVAEGTLTWNRSRAHPGSRRLDKADLAGVAHRAGQDLPVPCQLADPAAVLWPADVPVGRPRRVSQCKSLPSIALQSQPTYQTGRSTATCGIHTNTNKPSSSPFPLPYVRPFYPLPPHPPLFPSPIYPHPHPLAPPQTPPPPPLRN